MSKSIFVSCVYEDSYLIKELRMWADKNVFGKVVITFETEDKRDAGFEAIREHIKRKIQGASVLMVLVGEDTHNHDWINSEVELANSFHKKVLCIRVPGTNGAIPRILSKYKLLLFDSEIIKAELESIS